MKMPSDKILGHRNIVPIEQGKLKCHQQAHRIEQEEIENLSYMAIQV